MTEKVISSMTISLLSRGKKKSLARKRDTTLLQAPARKASQARRHIRMKLSRKAI